MSEVEYPDVDPIKWAEEHGLSLEPRECEKCGKEVRAMKPLVIPGYAGLTAEDHGCGEEHTHSRYVPVSAEKVGFWKNFGEVIFENETDN